MSYDADNLRTLIVSLGKGNPGRDSETIAFLKDALKDPLANLDPEIEAEIKTAIQARR